MRLSVSSGWKRAVETALVTSQARCIIAGKQEAGVPFLLSPCLHKVGGEGEHLLIVRSESFILQNGQSNQQVME